MLKLHSEQEKSAWKRYLNVLEYRSLVCHIGRAMLQIGYAFQGNINWHETEKYIEEGGPPNVELAKRVFPYARIAMITILILRVVLILLSMKWMRITRCYFYFE